MRFILTGRQAADSKKGIPLLTGITATHMIADKGYDSDEILAYVRGQGAEAVIPPRSSRKTQRECSRKLYRERKLIERALNMFKQWRVIAIRYDRRSLYFLAALHLSAPVTWSA